MADVTPTGVLSKSVDGLKQLLAESTTFQTMIGAEGDAAAKITAAKAKIHIADYAPGDDDFDRPFAIISRSGNDNYKFSGTGLYQTNGTLELSIESEISTDYKADAQASNAELEFTNNIAAVISECQALSSTSGYLITRSWDIIDGPFRIVEEGVADIYVIKINVQWGLEFD